MIFLNCTRDILFQKTKTNKNWTKTKHLQTIKTKLKEKLKGKEKFENELKKNYNNSGSDYTVVVW